MTIDGLLIAGAIVGFLIGLIASSQKIGCAALWVVPVSMIVYVAIWQGQNPESITSTSGLAFVFGPLWPSLGALGGFILGKSVRWLWNGE